jgi:glycerol-3-phosphate dehydrogenase
VAESRRIAVVGTGAWGTALAAMLAHEGRQVSLWARSEEEALALRASRENKRFLPDVVLPESLVITSSLEQALDSCAMLMLVVPARTWGRGIDLRSLGTQSVPRDSAWSALGHRDRLHGRRGG